MRFSIGAVAALATVGSNAFLLPPTLSSTDKEIVHILPFISTDSRLMDVDCPNCPVVIEDIQGHKNAVTTPVESFLKLNFSVVRGDTDRLLLNDIQIYPVSDNVFGLDVLSADQAVKTADSTFQYAATPRLGFGLTVEHLASSRTDGDDLGMVKVIFDIYEVAGQFVEGVPSVHVNIVEAPSGRLDIASAATAPAASRPNSATVIPEAGKKCTDIFCKWKAIVAAKLSKLKGCGAKKLPENFLKLGHGTHGGHRPLRPHRPHRGPHRGGRPHMVHPHGGHRPHHFHHQKHGRFARVVRSVVFHVIIPVLIGATFGFAATILGLIVGHFIVFVWRAVFRRAGYQKVQQEEVIVDEESKSFIEHEAPPPVYEDAPAYTEGSDEKTAQ